MHPLDRANKLVKVMEGTRNLETLDKIITKTAEVVDIDAIPLEQLKGDIARAGHPIKQMLAIDREENRLFFTDKDGQHLVAEFANADEGHRIKKIGLQGNIAKEYDVIDLDPSSESKNPGEVIETEHDEDDDISEEVGMIPAGTPGDKPEDDRGFAAKMQKANRVVELIKELDGATNQAHACACGGEKVCGCNE